MQSKILRYFIIITMGVFVITDKFKYDNNETSKPPSILSVTYSLEPLDFSLGSVINYIY